MREGQRLRGCQVPAETAAIDAVGDEPATPARLVSLVEVRIGADEPLAPEQAIFTIVGECGPIAILRYKYVRRAVTEQNWATKNPVCEGITARQRYVIFFGLVLQQKMRAECKLFIRIIISQEGQRWKSAKILSGQTPDV